MTTDERLDRLLQEVQDLRVAVTDRMARMETEVARLPCAVGGRSLRPQECPFWRPPQASGGLGRVSGKLTTALGAVAAAMIGGLLAIGQALGWWT